MLALAAADLGGVAFATHGVILLTAGGKLPSATANYLAAHRGIHYAVGGPAAVADPSASAARRR
jgi:hypothetical protein